MYAGRPQRMKLVNEVLVREALLQRSESTKAQLVADTGLSQTTIGQALAHMESAGQICQVGLKNSSGGRRAAAWALEPDCVRAFSLIIEPGQLIWGISNALGTLIKRGQRPVQKDAAREAAALLQDLQASTPDIARQAAAIGVPGAVCDGRIITGFLQEAWNNTDIRSLFAQETSTPVTVENDLNAMALGYMQAAETSGKRPDSLAYIHFNGLCTGAGLVANGQVLRGALNFAGELGFLPMGKGLCFDQVLNTATSDTDYTDCIASALFTVNCVINPARLVVGGTRFRFDLSDAVRERFNALAESRIRPQLCFIEDSSPYYLTGLGVLAIEQAFPAIRLVDHRQQA